MAGQQGARDAGAADPKQGLPMAPLSEALERWTPAAGGAGLAYLGLRRRSLPGAALAVAGAGLIYSAIGARSTREGALVRQSVSVNREPAEVYAFWRALENLPRFMRHLISVEQLDGRRSHWVATAPFGQSVAWDAEITHDRPGELIAWRSLGNAAVPNAGTVRFDAAPGGRGTQIAVELRYRPPAGPLGVLVAKLTGREPSRQAAGDLRRLRAVLEAGEAPTTSGQPEGRRSPIGAFANRLAVAR